MSRRLGVGLIGLGGIQLAHAYAYQDSLAQVVAVCDIVHSRARERAAELSATAYTHYSQLLQDPAVELVDITLPHNLHYEVARAALESGKHTLVEKPMVGSHAQAAELIDLARRRGMTFTVAENTRFVTAYTEAATLLMSGQLGEPRLVRTLISGSEVRRLRDTGLWKGRRDGSLGGVIIDSGPHSFYLLKWLFGEVASVYGHVDRLVAESEVEDHALVGGRLTSGAIFTTEYTFTAEIPWSERLEVYGSEGSLIVDQLDRPPAVRYHGGDDYDGTSLSSVPYEPMTWKFHSIVAGVRDFVQAVRDSRPPAVDPDDGAYAIYVVEKAYESVTDGGRVVDCRR